MKPYDRYKTSGVDWLGDIPEHWEVKKLKYLTKDDKGTIKTGPFGSQLKNGDFILNGKYKVYNQRNVLDANFEKGSDFITEEKFDELSDFEVFENDVLVTTRGTIGKCAVFHKGFPRGVLHPCLIRIQFNSNKVLNDWIIFYVNESSHFLENVMLLSNSTTIEVIYSYNLKEVFIPIPSIAEQTAIAKYLDEKTAQIDKLISGKQGLIELLKEERMGVINQAVTRGINPHAKLKPSGIDWLGDIPKHWEVKRLKFVVRIKYGLGQPPNQKDDGLPLLRATNIERGKIVEKDLILVDPEDIPYDRDPVLKENDIIVVRSGAYTADSAIIPKKYEGAIAGYDMVVRVVEAMPIFVAYCLLSNYVLVNQLFLQRLRAAQPHLNKEELGETFILLPDTEEQKQIVQFIETATDKIDSTITKIEKEIEYLKEYRTALISEVVTGKIKVV